MPCPSWYRFGSVLELQIIIVARTVFYTALYFHCAILCSVICGFPLSPVHLRVLFIPLIAVCIGKPTEIVTLDLSIIIIVLSIFLFSNLYIIADNLSIEWNCDRHTERFPSTADPILAPRSSMEWRFVCGGKWKWKLFVNGGPLYVKSL